MRYRELPFGTRRGEIEASLAEVNARKCCESISPAYEVVNEWYRVGRRRIRVCTEDEMEVSLWGSKSLVDELYTKITQRSAKRREARTRSDLR
jgi:hypothetical protein